jgi:hypothetical protein
LSLVSLADQLILCDVTYPAVNIEDVDDFCEEQSSTFIACIFGMMSIPPGVSLRKSSSLQKMSGKLPAATLEYEL